MTGGKSIEDYYLESIESVVFSTIEKKRKNGYSTLTTNEIPTASIVLYTINNTVSSFLCIELCPFP